MSERNSGPWRWAEGLLERLLPENMRETIVGDLREEFVEAIEPQGERCGRRSGICDRWRVSSHGLRARVGRWEKC